MIDRIEAEGRGKPIGEQMLVDAHRRDDENAVSTFFGYNGTHQAAQDQR